MRRFWLKRQVKNQVWFWAILGWIWLRVQALISGPSELAFSDLVKNPGFWAALYFIKWSFWPFCPPSKMTKRGYKNASFLGNQKMNLKNEVHFLTPQKWGFHPHFCGYFNLRFYGGVGGNRLLVVEASGEIGFNDREGRCFKIWQMGNFLGPGRLAAPIGAGPKHLGSLRVVFRNIAYTAIFRVWPTRSHKSNLESFF